MKTLYSRRRNALIGSRGRGTVVALLAVILLLGGLSFLFPAIPLTLSKPGFALGGALSEGTRSLSGIFSTADELQQQIATLQSDTQTLQNENRILRARVHELTGANIENPLSIPTVTAGVLARPPLSPYDTLLVSLPDTHVSEGARVYSMGYVPLGTISQIIGSTARVELYSFAGRKTEGWVGEARTPITLTGESAGAFSSLVPRDSVIAEGDVVYLPGPGALAIGLVTSAYANPASTEKNVSIVPYVNIFSITHVRIAN